MNVTLKSAEIAEYGYLGAALINNFRFWIVKNRADGRNLRDGHTWTYNSIRALADQFWYETPERLRRAIDQLVDDGVLMVGNYNADATNRTKWYAFCDEARFAPAPVIDAAPEPATEPVQTASSSHLADSPNAFGEPAKSLIYTDVYTNKNKARPSVDKPPRKTPMTADWTLPKEFFSWVRSTFPNWSTEFIHRRAHCFRDYWLRVAGRSADWLTIWRDYCVRQAKFRLAASQHQPDAVAHTHTSSRDVSYAIAQGRQLGLSSYPGETLDAFWRRIVRAQDAPPGASAQPRSVPLPAAPMAASAVVQPIVTPESTAVRQSELARAKAAALRGTANMHEAACVGWSALRSRVPGSGTGG